MEEPADGSSQQPMEGGPAYAAVVTGRSDPHQECGPSKTTATRSDIPEPAASPEADSRRISLEDMSGPLMGMPAGTTPEDHTDIITVVPAGERHKTPIYVWGITDTRGFLTRLRGSYPSGLSAQMKEEWMIVPKTADNFRATVSALRSLGGSKGESIQTFSPPEDRCVRLLVKNLGRQCLRASFRRRWKPWASVSRGHATPLWTPWSERSPRASPHPTFHSGGGIWCGSAESTLRNRTLLLASLGRDIHGTKGPIAV
jgi:hypothetical protein